VDHPLPLGIVAAFALCSTVPARAENAPPRPGELGGVDGSGMEQGSGAITNRSEVAVSVESLPGSPALRLQALGDAVSTRMAALRACYVGVTRERPAVQGRIAVRVELREGRAALTVAEDGTGDRELSECVLRELRAAPFSSISGNAGGLVVMVFSNTAAEGAAALARDRGRAADTVERTPDGRPRAVSRTPGGAVEVVVTGDAGATAEAVAALARSVEARIGSILDCRRRASRGGLSPAGAIVISLSIPARGAPSGRRVESSVAFPQAPQCVIRAMGQAARGAPEAAGTHTVEVRYAE
jgi:hypothetical protein